jgi:hypothetical protein
VYLWWARLAGLEGLSAVGHRPGASAITLVLSGTLGLSVVEATAALEVALGVSVGLAATALLRSRAEGVAPWLGGLLAGTFAVHLAAGYLANLAFVPCFLAAIALLDEGRRRASVLAALALGAGGLAHPLFFLLGALVLFVAAATGLRSAPQEARRLAGAAVGAGALVGAGLLLLLAGPRPPAVDTSKDAFLRRAGLGAELREAYRERLLLRWPRYVPWLAVPLAFVGAPEGRGLSGRILGAWLWVTVIGVIVAFVTGWFPADRFVTFGFAIPLLSALGIERLRRGLGDRRVLSAVAVAGLAAVLLAGPAIVWERQQPFLSEDEVAAAMIAGSLAPVVGSDGPIAFLVENRDTSISFLASRAANTIRASVPPERIHDVVIVVPPRTFPVSRDPNLEVRNALERVTGADLRAAERAAGRDAVVVALAPFFSGVEPPEGALVVGPTAGTEGFATDPLEPASGAEIAGASVACLALLWVLGFGWASLGLRDRLTAVAAAPALGIAATTVVAVALDAAGVRVGSTGGAVVVSALAGGGGYLAHLVLERRARTRPAPEVEQEPAE